MNECKSILQVGCESQVCEEPRQTYKTELFAKIVTGFQLLTIFGKNSVWDFWQASEYTDVNLGTF